MSVPKKRRTKGSVGRRNSHSALKKNSLKKCSNCGQAVPQHQACPACGTYKGRDTKKKKAIKPETKKSK
ncbi:50S ribosomal protein L32 [Candidatus Falkowbacteria bacterium]|nr:50S ribosomal protein L32 [Candidatus Falkowbacteria bacterium]